MILSLLTSRLAGPIASGVAVLLAMALGWQTIQLAGARNAASKAEKRAAEAVSQLGRCQGNRATLEAALSVQNEAVAKWKAEGDAKAKAAREAADDARKAQRDADRLAARLAGIKSAPTCEGREAAVRDMVARVVR